MRGSSARQERATGSGLAKAFSGNEKRNRKDRRGLDRREKNRRLDERRRGGFGEVTPERRIAPRRIAVRRIAPRRKRNRRVSAARR